MRAKRAMATMFSVAVLILVNVALKEKVVHARDYDCQRQCGWVNQDGTWVDGYCGAGLDCYHVYCDNGYFTGDCNPSGDENQTCGHYTKCFDDF